MDQIECLQPDLIILDARFGNNSGLDVLQEIRNKYYDMPVILCSAYDLPRYDMKAIAANYFVIKSIDLTVLKSKISMVFETTYSYLPQSAIGNVK